MLLLLRRALAGIMPWVRFDDQFPIHRKVTGLSDAAFRLHVAAIFWCARNLTDGFVPEDDLDDVCARVRTPARFVPELLKRGTWHEAGQDCPSVQCPAPVTGAGWVIHDYLDYQFSKEQVLSDREKNAARQKKWRDEHRNGVSNAVSNGGSNSAPSRPGSVVDVVRSGTGRNARSPDDLTIKTIIETIHAVTARSIDAAWAAKIAGHILGDRRPKDPAAYCRTAIEAEPNPRVRFLPVGGP